MFRHGSSWFSSAQFETFGHVSAQLSTVWLSMAQHSLAQLGTAQHSWAHCGITHHGSARFGMVQHSSIPFGMVLHCSAWLGPAHFGISWHGFQQFGMVWYSLAPQFGSAGLTVAKVKPWYGFGCEIKTSQTRTLKIRKAKNCSWQVKVTIGSSVDGLWCLAAVPALPIGG